MKRKLKKEMEKKGIILISHAISDNFIDKIWTNQPTVSSAPAWGLPLEYTGESMQGKMEQIRIQMKEKKAAAIVLTALDDIAWAFNIRGSDITFNPVWYVSSQIS